MGSYIQTMNLCEKLNERVLQSAQQEQSTGQSNNILPSTCQRHYENRPRAAGVKNSRTTRWDQLILVNGQKEEHLVYRKYTPCQMVSSLRAMLRRCDGPGEVISSNDSFMVN